MPIPSSTSTKAGSNSWRWLFRSRRSPTPTPKPASISRRKNSSGSPQLTSERTSSSGARARNGLRSDVHEYRCRSERWIADAIENMRVQRMAFGNFGVHVVVGRIIAHPDLLHHTLAAEVDTGGKGDHLR